MENGERGGSPGKIPRVGGGHWAEPREGTKGFRRVEEKGAVTREVTGRKVGEAGLSGLCV